MKRGFQAWLLFLCLPFAAAVAAQSTPRAGGVLQRLEQARQASKRERAVAVPPGAKALRNIAYGADPAQRFDVYLPTGTGNAPVFFFVHGGGWAVGDKTNPGIEGKLEFWLAKGYAVVSTNYRMVPEAAPLQQARDVALAAATAQRRAAEWGIDPRRFVLVGHSAGAHLVALLGADPDLLARAGALRPRGVVSLDSAALDVPQMMEGYPRRPRLYDRAFGAERSDWAAASPYHRLSRASLPLLAVCSTRRPDACPQARALARKAATLGVRVDVLPEAMTHMEINRDLGMPSDYTVRVADFIGGLLQPSRERP